LVDARDYDLFKLSKADLYQKGGLKILAVDMHVEKLTYKKKNNDQSTVL